MWAWFDYDVSELEQPHQSDSAWCDSLVGSWNMLGPWGQLEEKGIVDGARRWSAVGLTIVLEVRLAVFDHVASYPPVIVPVRELADLVKSVTNKEALGQQTHSGPNQLPPFLVARVESTSFVVAFFNHYSGTFVAL
eukprot:4097075-Amphidinium_carterae.1